MRRGSFLPNDRLHKNSYTPGECHVPVRQHLSPAESTVIKVLGLITRSADIAEVTTEVKRDPVLQYNLLRYLNSAKFSLASYGGFQSFEHAIMLLGYRQFTRWLSMFLLHSRVEGGVPELYRTAITRAKQMELLAGHCGARKTESDSVFITGAFSLADRILGVTMEALLAPLSLGEAVTDALLTGEGRYAPLLKFAQASESGTEDELYGQLQHLGISARDANQALIQGMYYAAGAMQAD